MSWILFRNWCSRAWLWLREHWQIPFLVAWSVLIWVLTRRNTDALVEVIEAKRQSHKEQLEVLTSTHSDELLMRDNLVKKYEDTLENVEEKLAIEKKNLTESQKNEIKEVVRASKGNPDEIKKRIEKEFGIKFVE